MGINLKSCTVHWGEPLMFDTLPKNALITGSILAIAIATTSFVLFDSVTASISCVLGWAMLAIALYDARHFIILDILCLPAIPAGLGVVWILTPAAFTNQRVMEHLAAAILAAGGFYLIRFLYFQVRKREGLGLGDVKLAAVAGAWTGLQGISTVILLACFGAFCFVLYQRVAVNKQMTATTVLPFGAFLAPAIWLVWVLGIMLPV